MTLVFVYGTLMQGECRHAALESQKFIGPARTSPRYLMLDCGSYPGLIESEETTVDPDAATGRSEGDSFRAGRSILGELYEVDAETLSRLDSIEEVDSGLYRRCPIELASPHHETQAVAWFYAQPSSHLPPCGTDWRTRAQGD